MENKQIHDLLIHTKDLTRWYPGSPKTIFQKFNLGLYKNDFTIVSWNSWSGKSSLAKLIIGQYKTPSKMLFHWHEDMSKYSTNELQGFRKKIWVIFQDYKLLPWKTVAENILYPLSIMGHSPLSQINKLNRVLKTLWLENHKDVIVKFLSWGEKQKVAIARALIHDPEFIIADEPTWNLDNDEKHKIADIFIQLHELGQTILLITHDTSLKKYIQNRTKTTNLVLWDA